MRRYLSVGALLALVTGLLLAPTSAQADEPPLQWVENSATTVTLKDLTTKGLPVSVHNATRERLTADIRVAGPEALADRLEAVQFVVAENADASTTLKVAPGTDPEAGTYAMTLVVSPVTGGTLDRRPLTVTVAAPAASPVATAALDPATLPDVTIPATNFLASPFAEIGPLLLVLAGVIASALLIFQPSNSFWLGAGIVAIGVCIVLGIVAGTFYKDPKFLPGQQLIHAESLAVSANAQTGYVGGVLDGNGDVAWLEVVPGRLHARDLEHAGEHKGQIDLNGSAEGGSASATVNVRDWWPWALLAIALGVLVGQQVRRWFERDRERSELRLRLDALRVQMNAERAADPRLALWFPRSRVDQDAEAIKQLLDGGNTTAAEKQIDALEQYLDDTARLRNSVAALIAAADGLAKDVESREVLAITLAEQTIEQKDAEDERTRTPAEAQKQVDSALELITRIGLLHAAVRRWILQVENALDNTEDTELPRKEALTKALAALRAKADLLLQAPDVDTATQRYNEASELLPEGVTSDPSPPSDVRPVWTPPGTAVPAARIEVRILSGGQAAAGKGNVDDVFLFRAVFEKPAPAPFDVQWEFSGTGEKVQQRMPTSGEGAWIEHRYEQPGAYTVRLLDATGHDVASLPNTVTGPSRLVTSRDALERRGRRFTRTAFALTIASGVSTLYMVDPAWGTNEDYVKALLWGAVVGEGVALVAAIIGNRFPAQS